jgi:hypothetical protein
MLAMTCVLSKSILNVLGGSIQDRLQMSSITSCLNTLHSTSVNGSPEAAQYFTGYSALQNITPRLPKNDCP